MNNLSECKKEVFYSFYTVTVYRSCTLKELSDTKLAYGYEVKDQEGNILRDFESDCFDVDDAYKEAMNWLDEYESQLELLEKKDLSWAFMDVAWTRDYPEELTPMEISYCNVISGHGSHPILCYAKQLAEDLEFYKEDDELEIDEWGFPVTFDKWFTARLRCKTMMQDEENNETSDKLQFVSAIAFDSNKKGDTVYEEYIHYVSPDYYLHPDSIPDDPELMAAYKEAVETIRSTGKPIMFTSTKK